jgi:heme/copper-type cytochrome/quinol oxidase subunit 1
MPTPPMLRSREPAAVAQPTPDPLVALNVAAMSIVGIGLLLAGILAVYDWKTPGAEAPLVFWTAVIAVALLAIDVLVVALRYIRRLRLGL